MCSISQAWSALRTCLHCKAFLHLDNAGVRHWPTGLSVLTGLRDLRIIRPFFEDDRYHYANDIASAENLHGLTVEDNFFACQPRLTSLHLEGYVVLHEDTRSFSRLQSLQRLWLDGCDLIGPFLDTVYGHDYQACKPFQGMSHLQELALIHLAPSLGRWPGVKWGLCGLGVTSLTNLQKLVLSENGIRQVPQQLSMCMGLTFLELSRNPLAPDCVTDPAILALTRLQYLGLAACMTASLVSVLRPHSRHLREAAKLSSSDAVKLAQLERAFMPGWLPSVTGHLSHGQRVPDVQLLMQTCPDLQRLNVCNAA